MPLQISQVERGVWKLSFGSPSRFTPVKFRCKQPASMDSLPAVNVLPWSIGEAHFQLARRGCHLELPASSKEDFYGLGLQLRSFRQTGKKKTLRVNSDPTADLGDSHAPVPFYLSTAGYGVFVDTARYATFYFASHDKKGVAQIGDSDSTISVNTDDLYSADYMAGQRCVAIDVPSEQGVDVYVFGGPTMRDALRRYILFSGGGALPPLWGLGVCYRGYAENDDKATIALARRIRESHIPCDCIGLEPGWQSHSYSCSYIWDSRRFPEPRRTVGELRALGFEVNLWEHAFVYPTAPLHSELSPFSGNVSVWNGLVPDFSIPKARKIFSEYHRSRLFDLGIRAVKLDECDNSDFIKSAWSFPEYSQFPSGMDGEEMHSLFGNLYMRTLLDAFDATGFRTWSNVRSAQALAAPYPFVLYSDLYDQRDFTKGLLNAGLSGLLWTPEVRQCASVDDFIRRLQLVVFSPMALINGWMIRNPPWEQVDVELNNQNVLLQNADEITALCRSILQIRMSLIPYLYAAFADYAFKGIPPMRPLVLDYPDDENVRNIDDEFMIGESLLFAPLTASQTERDVYLPSGKLRFWRDGKLYAGEKSYRMPCPLEEMLLFVKDCTLLPWAKPVEHVSSDISIELTARIYGHATACRLYDGDAEHVNPSSDAWLECRIANGSLVLSRPSRLYSVSGIKCVVLEKNDMPI